MLSRLGGTQPSIICRYIVTTEVLAQQDCLHVLSLPKISILISLPGITSSFTAHRSQACQSGQEESSPSIDTSPLLIDQRTTPRYTTRPICHNAHYLATFAWPGTSCTELVSQHLSLLLKKTQRVRKLLYYPPRPRPQ